MGHAITEKECERCGEMFPATYRTITLYCEECRKEIEKEDAKRYFKARQIKEAAKALHCTGHFEDAIYM